MMNEEEMRKKMEFITLLQVQRGKCFHDYPRICKVIIICAQHRDVAYLRKRG